MKLDMSRRLLKKPLTIPEGVKVTREGATVICSGRNGQLTLELPSFMQVKIEGETMRFDAASRSKRENALAGTLRALVNNMMIGVGRGFEKRLSVVGVGYRTQVSGNMLNVSLGFSHPVQIRVPEGLKVESPSQTEIVVRGADKQRVGQFSAELRALRSPEPYKGKGMHIEGQQALSKLSKKMKMKGG